MAVCATALAYCPPWVIGLAGFGLGAMSKQSLRRLSAVVGRVRQKPQKPR